MCTCSPDRVEGKHHGTFNMACVQPEKAHQKKCGLLSNCCQHRRSPEELRTTSKGAFQLVSEIRASRPQQMNSEPSWTSINLKCSLGIWITPWTHFVKSKPIWGVNGASAANNISWQSLMHTLERAEISFHCRPGLECKPVNKPQQRDAHDPNNEMPMDRTVFPKALPVHQPWLKPKRQHSRPNVKEQPPKEVSLYIDGWVYTRVAPSPRVLVHREVNDFWA